MQNSTIVLQGTDLAKDFIQGAVKLEVAAIHAFQFAPDFLLDPGDVPGVRGSGRQLDRECSRSGPRLVK